MNNPGYRAVDFDDLFEAYAQQISGLIDGGSRSLIDRNHIRYSKSQKAALAAATEVQEEKGTNLPIMISGTITDASGRTLSGQTTEAFLISLTPPTHFEHWLKLCFRS